MSWELAAQEFRDALDRAIPQKWKLSEDQKSTSKDVRDIPRTCGLLSAKQLEVTEQSATDLLNRIASGELSSVQVVEAFCGRAAIAHQLVNCLTTFFPEEALKRAAELDEHLRREGKPVGPLHGLPIALKDTFDVPGKATTWGYVTNASHRAERESAIVKILREAGAVFYVKTTMPQTGMALETISPLFGRTLNPFNTDFVAGGSSGGDAVLVAMHGSPLAPSTDIGGSIRAPAAFNGLYGIRPTADRIPKRAMKSVESGQLNIRVSCGPVCHSMADLKLFTRTITSWPSARYDTTSIPLGWRNVDRPTRKLAFGLLESDGAVRPHPPILRAMRETAEKLKAQGHEVIPFKLSFDSWEASQVYFDIYYQCGIEESMDMLAKAGEALIAPVQELYNIYKIRSGSLTAKEVLERIKAQNRYREVFSDAWDKTAESTKTGLAIDGIICPASPSAGYPHDYLPWWGYTCLFNLLDYPSTILPLKGFKISEREDPKDEAYNPNQSNPFDAKCYDIYDPVRWGNQPVTLQIVGRPFDDEELVAITEAVDYVVNGDS
ncbi:amidase [Thozetella sp. PMI_491]|nr:amidase [Thozetella sp. PMI_491]